MNLSANLHGQRALVTGASSGGFGRYFAQLLAQSGAHVTVTARRLEPLDALVEEIIASGGSADAAQLDVAQLDNVKEVLRARDPFDIVVNNAGVDVAKPILEQTEQDYDYVMGVNLKGVWNIGVETARAMQQSQKRGTIINIASITGMHPINRLTPYATSKSAVIHMTKQMALELAPFGIRVNAISPGYFESDMTRDYFETDRGKETIERIPMRRLGDYESLGGVLLLLASDASAFMTGSVIAVDGGHLINSL
jgi:NAD(P)-dependent dehydrogenase (short-subunit alcohol dehydrogenase family)|tara:strand:+ start:629 stop:1387 length:759 start_codon:yes stop_codon:yes gene_type:complete